MSTEPARILLVAHRTAATAALCDAVKTRAEQGPCEFTLVVPRPDWDPNDEAEVMLELALPLLDRAAGSHVRGIVGPVDALEAVRVVHAQREFDEVIVSTLPAHLSKWLHLDLPHRITHELGLPVQVVTASHQRHEGDVVHGSLPDHV